MTSPGPDHVGRLIAARTGGVQQTAVSGVAVANTGLVAGDFVINAVAETASFWTEPFPLTAPESFRRGPAGLLAAEGRLVRFTGRTAELRELTSWRDSREELAVMLVHAPGGQGKTRLAAAFAEQSAKDGWAVAQARHSTDPRPSAEPFDSGERRHGLLVVVDYAERWPRGDLERLLRDSYLHQGGPARVLLLARPAGYWWRSLANPLFKLRAAVSDVPLGPLASSVAEKQKVFVAARDRFAEILGAGDVKGLRPAGSLADDAYELVLTLHLAALVAVDARIRGARPPADPGELSGYLLDREYDHWHAMRENGRISVPPETMGRMVGLATLTRSLPTAAAAKVLTKVDLADSPAAALPLLSDHATCYPPRTSSAALEPLFPDRLAEDFLARLLPSPQTPGDGWAADLPARLLEPDGHLTTALTVLVETASRWEHVRRDYLFPLLKQRPQIVTDADGASLVVLADYAEIDVLVALDAHLPAEPHPELDTGIAAMEKRLVEYGLARTTSEVTKANLYRRLATRLNNAGLRAEALDAVENMVAIHRALATRDPDSHLPDLAHSLTSLSVELSGLDRDGEAFTAAAEAVAIWQRLAETEPSAYESDLAFSLTSLGNLQLGPEQRAYVLDAAQKSIGIWQRLAESAEDEQSLALMLTLAGGLLSRLDRREEAVTTLAEVVAIRRRLATSSAYQPDLAGALETLGVVLSELGRAEEAQAAMAESVQLWRDLANANPAAHQRRLATALGHLGNLLADLGRPDEALTILTQAVDVLERLDDTESVASQLATALTVIGVTQSRLAQPDEALTAQTEALELWRRLAKADPSARVLLVMELISLGHLLSQLDRQEQAHAASAEATELSRQLVRIDPAAERYLAAALTNLGATLGALDRHEEAAEAEAEAAGLWQRLAGTGPAAESHHAAALNNLADSLCNLRRLDEALIVSQNSVEIYERIAAQPADIGRRNAYTTLAEILESLGRPAEAESARNAVGQGHRHVSWKGSPDAY